MIRARRIALVLLTLYGVASVAIGIVLAEIGLHPPRSMPGDAEKHEAVALGAANGLAMLPLSLDTPDGTRLRAWFFPARDLRTATVIVTHGVAAHRGHALALTRRFLKDGYAVLAPDARGHGESGGIASYGVRERDDLHRWIDLVVARRPGTCVVGVGASMGAAQLLQAAADDPRLCGVVAESSFSSFREVAFDRVGQYVHTGPWFARTIGRPAIAAAFLYTRLRYGVDLGRASPLEAVRSLRTPVLLVHGLADTNIPIRHAEALGRANPAVRVWTVPGGGHGSVWAAAGEELPRRIGEFIREVGISR